MPSTSDTLSPSSSLGKTGSSQLHRAASHESLNAHPLLSSSSPSSSALNQALNPDTSTSATPRYVPYTPRHRPPTSSATTGMTPYSSLPVASLQHHQGGATSKLQLQNLKAAAQGIGLANGTVGWVILDKLIEGEPGSEWDEIWAIIMTTKPTLLLPVEPYSGETITPEFVKDHVAFCNGPSPSPLVTLSGLRGSINNGTLMIQSTLSVTSQPFCDLLKPDSQSAALMALPPLPSSLIPNGRDSYPSFSLSGSTSLPLPPRSHAYKPPLPPRPGALSSTPPKPTSVPRISNPFASLFKRPDAISSSSNLTTSPSPSLISLPSEDAINTSGVCAEVAAFSVSKKIIKKYVGKELSRLIKEEIKGGLVDCPSWVVDRVTDFTGPLHPIPKAPKRLDIGRTSSGGRSSGHRGRESSTLSLSTLPSTDPSALAEAFQKFYASVEEDLRAELRGRTLLSHRRKDEKRTTQSQDESNALEVDSLEDDKVQNEKEGRDSEVRIREILERVETVMCSVFYDRTFCPLSGDDASHDDALANRIAGLNMLDLGLEHLGVDIPDETIKNSVHKVVKVCGAILQRLENSESRSPGRKSALLVEAHKQIVDGLSRLPQIRLRPEREFEAQNKSTPKASSFAERAALEANNVTSVLPTTELVVQAPQEAADIKEAINSMEDAGTVSLEPTINSISRPLSDFETAESTEIAAQPVAESLDMADSQLSKRPSLASPPLLPGNDSPHEVARSSTPTSVSGDLLFPLLIFSVVKANPAHLVSHLRYTQRFRSKSVGGQEGYCLINLMAVVEFLEHVDMDALGLGDSERVMSTDALTPILLAHGPDDSDIQSQSPFSTRLGKRVNQQVEELAGLADSANKVITGVVDSSFGVLRGFLTSSPEFLTSHAEGQDSASRNALRPGFGLLRRASGFSIANVAASLPGAGRPKTPAGSTGEEGRQLIEVSSRPESIKESGLEDEKEERDTTNSSVISEDESLPVETPDRGDARSIKSFSSMMSRESRDRDRDRVDGKERMSLTNRLANMSVRTKFVNLPVEQHREKSPPPSSRPTSRPSSSLLPPSTQSDIQSVTGPSSLLPKIRIPPPNRRFLECSEQDVRVGEVGELLREYRRMVQALRLVGALEEQ